MSLIPGLTPQQSDAAIGGVAGLAVAGPPGALAGLVIGWLFGGMGSGSSSLPGGKGTGFTTATAQGIVNSAGPAVASAVAGAVAAGDTTVIAQGHTISVTGGDPSIQGSATYLDPNEIPDASVRSAWLEFIANIQANTSSLNLSDPAIGDAIKVMGIVKKYAPAFLGAAASAGYATTLGGVVVAGPGITGGAIGAIAAAAATAVLVVDAGLIAFGVGTFIESFSSNTGNPRDESFAEAMADAMLTGDQAMATAATAIYNGTATQSQYNYVSQHQLNADEMQQLTTNAKIAAGTGSKQLYDPTAPGGYITVGSDYGVKQAQTNAQNVQQAIAEGTHAGGMTEAEAQEAIAEEAAYNTNTSNFNIPI